MQKKQQNFEQKYNTSFQNYLATGIGLSDLEAIRLILLGDSVIDWNRANFRSLEEVDRFLQLNLINLQDSEDKARILHVHQQAIRYLEEHLELRFPNDLKNPKDI